MITKIANSQNSGGILKLTMLYITWTLDMVYSMSCTVCATPQGPADQAVPHYLEKDVQFTHQEYTVLSCLLAHINIFLWETNQSVFLRSQTHCLHLKLFIWTELHLPENNPSTASQTQTSLWTPDVSENLESSRALISGRRMVLHRTWTWTEKNVKS